MDMKVIIYFRRSEHMGLQWGPLSLASTFEELLGRKSRGSSIFQVKVKSKAVLVKGLGGL
jgi:hypothetical protein